MTEHQKLNKNDTTKTHPASNNSRVYNEIKTSDNNNGGSSSTGQKPRYPNPPEGYNPDAATLRDQWRFAIRQYSRWYSQAWGTAILAGLSFFALGWFIKGSNPLPSFKQPDNPPPPPPRSSDADDKARR